MTLDAVKMQVQTTKADKNNMNPICICGRPTGHAGTPLDDQQAMLGLYAVLCYCSTRPSARPTRSVIKKYALADYLQRMSQGDQCMI